MRRIVVAAIIAGIVLAIGLILLGLMGDFLVDWAWFSAVHYPGIFWTVVGAKATLFFTAFLGSSALVGLNGLLAVQLSNRGIRVQPAAFDWRSVKAHNLSELLRLMPRHVSLLRLAVGLAFLLAILIAALRFVTKARNSAKAIARFQAVAAFLTKSQASPGTAI
jgi:uncharacterized membrane protein (UPF0182 family)